MNNEIKEMTKVLKSLGNKQASELYNYITNLQQENEKNIEMLNDIIKEQDMKLNDLQQEKDYYFKKNNELSTLNTLLRSDRDNYKSRIEKAVEYIEKYSRQEEMWFDNKKGELHQDYFVVCKTNELLNILNGRSDE